MQLVEGMRALAAIVLMFGANAQADEPKYGKVETFQPGKKYTCVPTADHKGWDCNEIAPGSTPGKQGNNVPSAETTPLQAPTAARTPERSHSRSSDSSCTWRADPSTSVRRPRRIRPSTSRRCAYP